MPALVQMPLNLKRNGSLFIKEEKQDHGMVIVEM